MASSAFLPIFLQPWAKIWSSAPNIILHCCLHSKKVCPPHFKPREAHFLGVRAWPHVPRGLIHRPENNLNGVWVHIKNSQWCFARVKKYRFFCDHRETDAQTDTQTDISNCNWITRKCFLHKQKNSYLLATWRMSPNWLLIPCRSWWCPSTFYFV